MKQHLDKINFFTLAGALVLVFLPWLNVQCSGRDLITQTGLQAAYGDASPSSGMEAMAGAAGDDSEEPEEEEEDEGGPFDSDNGLGFAYLVIVSILAVVIGLVIAALVLFKNKANLPPVGGIALVALGCILAQLVIGFPVESELEAMQAESLPAHNASDSSSDPQSPLEDSLDDLGRGLAASMMNFEVQYTNWLYLYILCLAAPSVIYLYQLVPNKKQQAEPGEEQAPPGY